VMWSFSWTREPHQGWFLEGRQVQAEAHCVEFLFHWRSGEGQRSVNGSWYWPLQENTQSLVETGKELVVVTTMKRPLARMREAAEHFQKPATLRQHLLPGARWMQERRAMAVEQWRVRRISAQGSRRHCHLNQALRALSDVAKRVAVRGWCLFFAFSPICRWPFLASL
jgi:hypothetical protein